MRRCVHCTGGTKDAFLPYSRTHGTKRQTACSIQAAATDTQTQIYRCGPIVGVLPDGAVTASHRTGVFQQR